MGVCSSKHVHTPSRCSSGHNKQHAANEAAAEAANSHHVVAETAQQQSSSGVDADGQLAAKTAPGAEPVTPRTDTAAEEYPATPITPESLSVDASPTPKVMQDRWLMLEAHVHSKWLFHTHHSASRSSPAASY